MTDLSTVAEPGDRPYTDDDVELAVRAAAHARYLRRWPGAPERASRYAVEMAADPMYRAELTGALAALAAAGRLRGSRPTPHLDSVKAQRDKLQDANDTLALTLAEAIGTLAQDGGGCSRGWIPAATVDRWRRALHEAEEARVRARPNPEGTE